MIGDHKGEEQLMRWNRLFFVCFSSLLFLCSVGCSKKKIVRIGVDPHTLVPISAYVNPGATLEWVATSPDEKFEIKFDNPGLCVQKSPIPASYGSPAKCDVPRQQQPGQVYEYSIEGMVEGKPIPPQNYVIMLSRPTGCPHGPPC